MADLNSVAPMLKETWVNTFETAFNTEIVALSRIEKTSDGVKMDVNARYVVIPLKVRRNQGLGSRPERGILPLPGKQGYVGTRVDLRTQYGVGEITAHTLKLVDSEPRAAINALDEELQGLKDDFLKDYARQVYGDGTGAMAVVTAVVGNDIEVDSLQYLDVDMLMDSVTTGGPTVTASGMLVEDFNAATSEITVDDATGVLVGDVLVRSGNYNQEINGFGTLIDDTTTVQNLSPATERRWASIEVDTTTPHAYDEVELSSAFDQVRVEAGSGKEPTVVFTSLGVQRGVYETLVQSRDFNDTTEFASGVSGLPFVRGSKQIPIVADVDFPEAPGATEGEFLGVHEPSVKLFREDEGLHFAEETGSMFIAAQDRSDAWEFRMRQFSQMGIKQRNNHFRVKSVNTG